MDHGSWNMGTAAFWLVIAAAAWGSHWEKARRNSEKHETLRRIIEKTGTVDEAKLKELFSASPATDWDWMKSKPGDGYRGLRVGGTIIVFLAAGVATCFFVLGSAAVIPRTGLIIGVSIASGIAMLGLGLFYSSRFAVPPPDRGNGPTR